MSKIELIQGDCLEKMKELINNNIKVDAIITDLPYGTTKCSWDKIIQFDKMWNCVEQLTNNNTPILLFGGEPFSSFLRTSNIKNYKYDIYWQKERATNIFQVKKRPGKVIENICVFYKNQPTYNPQMTIYTGPKRTNKIKNGKLGILVDSQNRIPNEYIDNGIRYPLQIVKFKRDILTSNVHPTQKPIELMEYLVKTFTNEGDTVLDFCMGSGSTGVACVNTNRNFIGIELDENYFNIAKERIEQVNENKQLNLFDNDKKDR
jgi:site-specific DNA-methyltransferase (adenine-specific)